MALCIKRKTKEFLNDIGDNRPLGTFVLRVNGKEVMISISSHDQGQVKIAIEADRSVEILRAEIIS